MAGKRRGEELKVVLFACCFRLYGINATLRGTLSRIGAAGAPPTLAQEERQSSAKREFVSTAQWGHLVPPEGQLSVQREEV